MSKENEGAPFVVKTFQLVNDTATNPLVGWSETRDSFVVWKPVDFAAEVLPQYFKHNNFCSFIRQLNTYGFHKVEGKLWEFKHESFREGHPELLKDIARRKSKKRGSEKDEPSTPFVDNIQTPIVIKEEPVHKSIKQDKTDVEREEVEKLRDLNQLLMKEVIRLQQQQETTQDTINQILAQLLDSRKEQHHLHKKVAKLTKEVSSQYNGGISIITPPPSPFHPSQEEDPLKFNNPALSLYGTNLQNGQDFSKIMPTQLQSSMDNFVGDESSLLGLDDLAHLELAPNMEQELARLLQNSLGTPPQSPQYQPQY